MVRSIPHGSVIDRIRYLELRTVVHMCHHSLVRHCKHSFKLRNCGITGCPNASVQVVCDFVPRLREGGPYVG